MQKTRVRRFGALLVGLALVAAACGDDEETTDTAAPTTEAAATQTSEAMAPETTEAMAPETTEAMAEGGDLEGFKGTTPLTPLGDDFKARLLEVDPDLVDFNYAAEGYDLTLIIALAAAKAGDDGIAYASEIQGITRN